MPDNERVITRPEAEPAAKELVAAAATGARPAALFQGYNSVDGHGGSTALQGNTKIVGGTSTVSYRVASDIETLSRALEIDQSLSIGFGPFGSVDQKLKFVSNLKITTNSISIVVYARHFVGAETMTDVALKQGVKPPEGNAELNEFFQTYGDSYITSMTRGGEYYAVYTFYSQTREEQTQLEASMKAAGIYEGVKIDASLQVKLDNFVSSTKTRVTFDQNVSGLLNPKLPTASDLITYAIAFPSLNIDAPAIIALDSSGYESVGGIGTKFDPVSKNRRYFTGDGVYGGLTSKLIQVQQLLNQISWLEDIYQFYNGFVDSKVDSVRKLAEADLQAIDDQLVAYNRDPTQSFTVPPLKSLDEGTPVLQYDIGTSGAHGGDGGGPFDDVDIANYLQQQTRISALQLRSGGRIDRLITTYQSRHGTVKLEHGGDGGGLGNVLTLLEGQFVTKVEGRSGARVDNLKFTITDGRSVSGGGGGGGPFTFEPPAGAFIMGFSGRSGAELDRIEFVHAKLKPAIWRRR